MRLKLNKKNITKLNSSEMSNVNGGGQGWSNFRSGNCNYSDEHAATVTGCDGNQVTTSCYKAFKA